MANTDHFPAEISRHIWRTKYRYAEGEGGERSIDESWRRIARALAAVEPADAALWEQRFFAALTDFKFLPGGRIQAGAGTARRVTLFNCFVMGAIEDSIPGIFRALQESAITMQQGGGIGLDFSTLRPRGTLARGAGTVSSGAVSFMDMWDAMCATLMSTGSRRGAMMASLRCDHPDIEEFAAAKRQPGRLRRFNLSVQVTDAFMAAVRADGEWPLVFPAAAFDAEGVGKGVGERDGAGEGETLVRDWPGAAGPVVCRVLRRVRARALWNAILRGAYDYAEPGVLFIDRINRLNNLWDRERISAANPCGEIPLPPYGACDLGSINLTRFVRAPFTPEAHLDLRAIAELTPVCVRMLDNVIDASRFPLPAQARHARGSRRIGLGVTGLGDALVMLGHSYGEPGARALAAQVMSVISNGAYRASIAIAREKGPFANFSRDAFLAGPFVRALPGDIRAGISAHGLRNSHLIAIAPTGTISLLAGNVSSGLEPIFAGEYTRQVLGEDGVARAFTLTDYALALWRSAGREGMPPAFVTATHLPASAHLGMQAAMTPFVDNAISKTINVAQDCPFEAFQEIYDLAFDLGVKGCTTFRPNPITGSVLSEAEAPPCCAIEREGD